MSLQGCESDVCTRLRRAVLRNNLPIVKLLVRHNPEIIKNPDYLDKSNTSLHLACRYGFLDLAKFLVDAGHEDAGVSRNTDCDTPLMAAAGANEVDVAKYLMERFSFCVQHKNTAGMDIIMMSAQGGALSLLPSLLVFDPPFSLDEVDNEGNTALHYAATEGNLGIIQLLLDYGASATAKNKANWNPIQYSSTMIVELHFAKMAAVTEKRQADRRKRMEKEKAEEEEESGGDVRGGGATEGGISLFVTEEDNTFPSFPTFPITPPTADPIDKMTTVEANLWKTSTSREVTPWRLERDGNPNKDEGDSPSSPEGPKMMFFP